MLILMPTLAIEEVHPISSTLMYFHYPAALHYQDLKSLVKALSDPLPLFYKLIVATLVLICLIFVSTVVGLLVRYTLILALTIYLFLGGCMLNREWGWVSKYINLVRNRDNQDNRLGSCKMVLMFAVALLSMMGMFVYGTKYSMENMFIYVMPLSETYYSEMLLKNYFLIELFYYIFCRSRLSLRVFPVLSLGFSLWVVMACVRNQIYGLTWLINLHLWGHLLLMSVFCLFENWIGNTEFQDDFTPSMSHPRALYYAGYDISW
jgi:hypothetical protein